MAEEAPYGGGSYFLQEMTYIGFGGYAAREYYYYSPYRLYRAREGGEGRATIKAVDIASALDRWGNGRAQRFDVTASSRNA